MSQMQIILTQDVENLGRAGQVVRVRGGYGRNYLIPRGLALQATRGNIAELEHHKRVIAREKARVTASHKAMVEQLKDVSVSVARKKGKDGKIFGSVGSKDIAEALGAQNIDLDRKLIRLDEPLREEGTFQVSIRFSADIETGIKVNVIGI
ncbi:MAG: 50S ribosomal protein L9 [Nannocystaceae bacterium]|nr:50S ribosomal protein L9 [Myxococcales bacterium]